MNNKLYVGNLSFNVDDESLRGAFEAYGNVTSCKLIKDRDTGRSKGFGFIEMSTEQEAQEAISGLDGRDLEGRNMRVNIAKPQEKREKNFGGNRW